MKETIIGVVVGILLYNFFKWVAKETYRITTDLLNRLN